MFRLPDHVCVCFIPSGVKPPLGVKLGPEFAAYFVDENSERDIAEIAVAPFFASGESERLRCDHLQ